MFEFLSLNWKDKIRINSSMIRCKIFHGIVHKSFHSNNVLARQNSIKLADSELSRRIRKTDRIPLNEFFLIGVEMLREVIVEGTPDGYSNLYSSKVLDYDPDKKPTTQEIVNTLSPMVSRQIIQNLKLNHGNDITSKRTFNSNNNGIEFNEALEPSDICINFPVAEITYTADLSKSFSN
ncbi:kinase-like domain-containing protein [Rhizophagus irregularis DAOM 181602=DAOM 197198]|nr:kinase-like domain-containing protein [Rhizophagus irregularis DAOM 181602=DAOM 197198]